MRFFIFIAVSILLIACNQQLVIKENEQTLATIREFPEKDTVIMMKDFFIKYRKDGVYLVGEVESPFVDSRGNFKSTSSVTIDISKGQVAIY